MEITVGTGEMKVTENPHVLITHCLGSCVGVVFYDKDTGTGGLAHILLPYMEEARDKSHPERFADAGVEKMIDEMKARGTRIENIEAKIFGGANMFPEIISSASVMDVGKRNIEAVKGQLKKHDIKIICEETCGNIGRTLVFDTGSGSVTIRTAQSKTRKY